jgi:hypothetical protein
VRQISVRLSRLTALPNGGIGAEIAGEFPLSTAPGHFYLASVANDTPGGYLRRPVFASLDWAGQGILELPSEWVGLRPDDDLDLIGACGRACDLPDAARNVLLIAGPAGPGRLLPLARAALARRAAVVLLFAGPQPLTGLPVEIEVRFGLEGLAEALAWADAVYADLPPAECRDLQGRLRAIVGHDDQSATLRRGDRRPARPRAWAYRLPPVPCGVGACGACAVATRHGWRLACLDGPWLDLLDLEL